jgi:hypothetical protein
MNIEHPTSNAEHRTEWCRFHSMLDVRCWMFDVCPPIANQPGGFAPGVESSPK